MSGIPFSLFDTAELDAIVVEENTSLLGVKVLPLVAKQVASGLYTLHRLEAYLRKFIDTTRKCARQIAKDTEHEHLKSHIPDNMRFFVNMFDGLQAAIQATAQRQLELCDALSTQVLIPVHKFHEQSIVVGKTCEDRVRKIEEIERHHEVPRARFVCVCVCVLYLVYFLYDLPRLLLLLSAASHHTTPDKVECKGQRAKALKSWRTLGEAYGQNMHNKDTKKVPPNSNLNSFLGWFSYCCHDTLINARCFTHSMQSCLNRPRRTFKSWLSR